MEREKKGRVRKEMEREEGESKERDGERGSDLLCKLYS